jgi:hypothetical protein
MHDQRVQSLAVTGKPGRFVTSADPRLGVHNGKQYIAILTLLDIIAWLVQGGEKNETQTIFEWYIYP